MYNHCMDMIYKFEMLNKKYTKCRQDYDNDIIVMKQAEAAI